MIDIYLIISRLLLFIKQNLEIIEKCNKKNKIKDTKALLYIFVTIVRDGLLPSFRLFLNTLRHYFATLRTLSRFYI